MTRRDGMDKIRKKGAPKDYKSGKPGPSGAERLRQRIGRLLVDAHRLECGRCRRGVPDEDRQWATRLIEALRAFNAAEYARSVPPFDIQAQMEGSWTCPTCGTHNWRDVQVCPDCHTSKP